VILTQIAKDTVQPPPVGYSIATAVQATGNAVSRTRMFNLIKTGELDARKVGRRTVVLAASLHEYLVRQPQVRNEGTPTRKQAT
jgi:hypothetical protein